jgi:hypothetical protein
MTLDPATYDLLRQIDRALGDPPLPDTHTAAAISVAVGRVLAGLDDPGAAADFLADFIAERARASAPPLPRRQATHPTPRTSDVRTEHV